MSWDLEDNIPEGGERISKAAFNKAEDPKLRARANGKRGVAAVFCRLSEPCGLLISPQLLELLKVSAVGQLYGPTIASVVASMVQQLGILLWVIYRLPLL